jgi:threonine dehydrogenase-like Zn-dependent dehydrogenase
MMRAARYYGKEDVRIEDTPRPQLLPGQILIKPSHVGICGTDLHEYIAGPTYALPSTLQPTSNAPFQRKNI